MLRSLKKAAQTLERNVNEAFSTSPTTHTAFVNTTLQIGPHTLRLGPVFAEGGFSFVHIATPTHNSRSQAIRYAVKRLPATDPDSESSARSEITLLQSIPPHPNIVAFHGATFHKGHAFLMFDLIDGGTLPEILSRPTTRIHSPQKLLDIFADALAAVVHLHSQSPPIAIRDVKLENILYDRLTTSYKLCDFGSATILAKRFITRAEILRAEEDIANSCSAMYRAPEIADVYRKDFVCEKVDVWALGCVWYALLFGTLPFDGMSSLQIVKGLTNIPQQPDYPSEFLHLLKSMLTVSPADRADSFALLEQVRALQGRRIDPELREIGRRLREQRGRDFGHQPEKPVLNDDSNLLSFNTMPTPTQSSVAPTKTTATLSVLQTATSQQDDGWADFDSAFGADPTTVEGPSKLTSSGQWPTPTKSEVSSVPRMPAPSERSDEVSFFADVSGSSTMPPSKILPAFEDTTPITGNVQNTMKGDAATSLIDFSDLQISSSTNSPLTSRPSTDPVAAPRTGATRSAPDFSDLIDFGTR